MKKAANLLMIIFFFAALGSFSGCDKDSPVTPDTTGSKSVKSKVKKSIASTTLRPDGGFECCLNDGLDFYIVTIKSAVFEDPSVASRFPGGLVGTTFVSPNIPGSPFPSEPCRGILPLGTYEFWVSTRKYNDDRIYTYSLPVTVPITSSLNWPLPWVYNGGEGWTHFCVDMVPGGSWVERRPPTWPQVTTPGSSGSNADGGFECCMNDGLNFYIVTIKSAVFEDPNVLNLYPDGLEGATFVSPNIPGSPFPSEPCRGILPLGTYEFWVSTRKFNEDRIYTYSLPVRVPITKSLNWPLPWVYNGGEGWTHFCVDVAPGGSWVEGRPSGSTGGGWPKPTRPYGSGSLQATLTWNNSSSNHADMDLHLYGPNGLHVYFGDPTNKDFSLDRDWQTQLGYATENIFSVNKVMPSGTYTVKVVNFSGDTKNFTARTILNGVATNYSGSLAEDASVTVKTFKIP